MSPGAQEAKKAGFMGPWGEPGKGLQPRSLGTQLGKERGVLGSLYIKEALDKNKNKLKHEFPTARTPGRNEHTSPQGDKFLLKYTPTSSMNRILFP